MSRPRQFTATKATAWALGLALQIILIIGSTAAQASTKIGILVFDGVLSSDVTAPIEVFGAASKKAWFSSYHVVTIAIDKKIITTEEGLKMVADTTIRDNLDLDVLIVPSSYTMEPLLKNKALIKFIQDQGKKASWVSSNCSGAYLLSEAGLVDGRNITTWAGGEADLQSKYPKVKVQTDINFVVDGKFVTSNGGPVSYEGAFALLSLMSSPENSKAVADYMMFTRLNPKSESIFKPKVISN